MVICSKFFTFEIQCVLKRIYMPHSTEFSVGVVLKNSMNTFFKLVCFMDSFILNSVGNMSFIFIRYIYISYIYKICFIYHVWIHSILNISANNVFMKQTFALILTWCKIHIHLQFFLNSFIPYNSFLKFIITPWEFTAGETSFTKECL